MGIGQKLLAVMETCRYMPKDGHNSYQNYDYTTAAGLNAKVNAALGEQGLYTQSKVTLLNSRDVTTAKGNQEKYVEVQIEITITDSEDEGSVTFSAIGSGQDAGDKATAKAQSMAMKYAYITGLCIAMADDPEEDSNTKAYLQDTPRGVSHHRFIQRLMKYSASDDVIINGTGTSLYYGIDKDGQRFFGNRNCGSMGYDLPAAMGASIAKKGKVLLLTGDGSIMMNMQELQTVVKNKIPIKIMIYSNNGYQAIIRTQSKFFNGRLTGCTPESGLDCPDWEKVCHAYGIPYEKISCVGEIDEKLPKFLNADGFGFCEVIDDGDNSGPLLKTTSKKLESGEMISAPIDELAPKLSEEEFNHYRYYREENCAIF